ncbi:hypothetical protein [Chryseobacterium foetidum]|uniref:hypothetical protein n=1 Tax=Chryseobacterium foetidum TaxID=2951057 RepID=UPI0021CA6105|nr:hypothetical protein [Chryseobacterium foetidum]
MIKHWCSSPQNRLQAVYTFEKRSASKILGSDYPCEQKKILMLPGHENDFLFFRVVEIIIIFIFSFLISKAK